MDTLIKWLDEKRGRRGDLAASLKITPGALSQWNQVPHDRVLDVERVTGISRHELRPDLSRIFVEPAPSKESAA
jgi:DNA-binding transcriptional regulator YdaS (Cro superfamily)